MGQRGSRRLLDRVGGNVWVVLLAPLVPGFHGVILPTAPLAAQEISLYERPWTGSIVREAGGPPVPIFDGWYPNEDGSSTLCFGYYSMNTEEAVAIPLGSNNFVEPAEFDGLQPTYFEPIPGEPFRYRRRYCVFPVPVPETFGRDDQVTWTIQREGHEPLSVPGKLLAAYLLDEPQSPGRGDTAPAIRFAEDAPSFRGRNGLHHGPIRARAGEPKDLGVWVDHPEDEVWVGWARHQGAGQVELSEINQVIRPGAWTTTTATFSEPGEYLLRVQTINDPVEAFEFHCCWTNGFIEVVVE